MPYTHVSWSTQLSAHRKICSLPPKPWPCTGAEYVERRAIAAQDRAGKTTMLTARRKYAPTPINTTALRRILHFLAVIVTVGCVATILLMAGAG